MPAIRNHFFLFSFCLFLTGLLLLLSPFHSANVSAFSPAELEVGITLKDSFLRLYFPGSYRLVEQSSGIYADIPPGEYTFLPSENGIEIKDREGRSAFLGNPLFLESSAVSEGSVFEIKNASYGKEYRGELKISRDGGSRIAAVNVIDLEAYLRGVVSKEMPPTWGNYGGMEALKAQVVAARTYALYHRSLQRHSGYHICDNQHCQVYGGKNAESPNTDLAVSETRGEILTYNGTVIEPVYHATNGGFTEEARNVWVNSFPYFLSEPDPYDDPDNPLGLNNMVIHTYATWEAEVPCQKASALFSSRGGPVERLVIGSSFPSGRVNELIIQGTGGKTVSLFKEQIRTVLGLEKIKSQLFTVSEKPEPRVWIASSSNGITKKESFAELEGKWAIGRTGLKSMLLGDRFPVLGSGGSSYVPYAAFIFKGRGFGHGIGMSQNGAYNRSRQGHGYKDILSFYYPGTEIIFGY